MYKSILVQCCFFTTLNPKQSAWFNLEKKATQPQRQARCDSGQETPLGEQTEPDPDSMGRSPQMASGGEEEMQNNAIKQKQTKKQSTLTTYETSINSV